LDPDRSSENPSAFCEYRGSLFFDSFPGFTKIRSETYEKSHGKTDAPDSRSPCETAGHLYRVFTNPLILSHSGEEELSMTLEQNWVKTGEADPLSLSALCMRSNLKITFQKIHPKDTRD